MWRYVASALLVALLVVSGGAWLLYRANGDLRVENASLARSVAALEDQRAQARLAADVARAAADRERARAAEYDALRETLLKGDDDAPLPDWFRAYLDRVLGGLR